MSALFPAWSNTVLRLVLVLGVLSVLALLTLLCVYVRTPWNTGQFAPVEQPVQFDHRHHVVDDAISCLYCHSGAETTALAGVPEAELCMGCHSQIWKSSPLLESVRRSYFSGKSIRWQRVNDVPDFVYFNHAVHVQRGVGCVSCHGRVDRMPRVYQEQPLTMRFCLDCHRKASRLTATRRDGAGAEPLLGDTELAAALARSAEDRAITRLTTCSACHR